MAWTQLKICECISKDVSIPPVCCLQFMHRTFRSRWTPIWADHDVYALLLGRGYVGCLAVVVRFEVGTMLVLHLLRLALRILVESGQFHAQSQFPQRGDHSGRECQIRPCSTRLCLQRDAGTMRPRNQTSCRSLCGCPSNQILLRDLGVYEIFVEVVKFDVSG